jgi:hypothetical protein
MKPDDSLIGYRMKKTSKIFTSDDLLELLTLRKQGCSISLQVTYPQRLAERKLWYIYIKRRDKGLLVQRNIGRAEREFMNVFYPEATIRQKERQNNSYLSLNSFFDDLIQRKRNSKSRLKGKVVFSKGEPKLPTPYQR